MSDFSEQVQEKREEESLERKREAFRERQVSRLARKRALEEEAEQLEQGNKVKKKKLRNRCIYLTMLECIAPQCSPDYCAQCPYNFSYCLPLVTKEAYQKIVSFSVLLAHQEGQFSALLSHGLSVDAPLHGKPDWPHPES